ncbi:hypothetical protein D3C71_2182460 [compost metagenome]
MTGSVIPKIAGTVTEPASALRSEFLAFKKTPNAAPAWDRTAALSMGSIVS